MCPPLIVSPQVFLAEIHDSIRHVDLERDEPVLVESKSDKPDDVPMAGLTRVAPVPVEPRGPTLRHIGDVSIADRNEQIVYEFAQSARLHTINLKRSVKSELFSAQALARWNSAVRRARLIITICFNLVYALSPISVMVPPHIGRAMALTTVPIGVPSCLPTLLALRYDMLYVLVRTYDFWFYWTIAVIACLSLGLYMGDARAISAVFIAVGMLICLLVDASVSLARTFILSSLMAGCLGCVVVVVVQLQLIPDGHDMKVSYNGRTVSLPDVIANGMVTMVIVLCRNAFRRREAIRYTTTNKFSNQLITFRCTVKLRPVGRQASRRDSVTRKLSSSVPHLLTGNLTMSTLNAVEMKFIPTNEKFDGRRILFGFRQSTRAWSRAARWTFAIAALSNTALTGVLFFFVVIFDQQSGLGWCIAAFAGACVLCSIVWTLLQPLMLRRLCLSFDFLFLSFQLTLLHACVCDTLRWDRRALLSLAGYVWIHLVLAIDALMPITRRRIGYHKAFAMLVAFGFVSGHGACLLKLIFDTNWQPYNRVLVDRLVFGHRLQLSVVPLIFSRQPMLIIWAVRLLWRIYKSEEGELILIRGAVAYDTVQSVRGSALVS